MSDTADSLQRDRRSALNCKKILLVCQILFLLYTIILWNRTMEVLRLIVLGAVLVMCNIIIERFREYQHGWNFWRLWILLTCGLLALKVTVGKTIQTAFSDSTGGYERFLPLMYTLVTEVMFPAAWWWVAHALQIIQEKQSQA